LWLIGATEMPRFLFSALGMLAGIGATAGDELAYFPTSRSTWNLQFFIFKLGIPSSKSVGKLIEVVGNQ